MESLNNNSSRKAEFIYLYIVNIILLWRRYPRGEINIMKWNEYKKEELVMEVLFLRSGF